MLGVERNRKAIKKIDMCLTYVTSYLISHEHLLITNFPSVGHSRN